MVPTVPAPLPAPAAWWPWPCCHLQGISHRLPLAPGLRPALREGVPRPGSSETKGWGKKANRQVLEDFPQHDPRIKKAKQILHIKTTTLQCNIKDYLLKRLWMLRWEVFPSTDAPSSNGRSLQPAVRGVLSRRCCSQKSFRKQRFASAVAMGSRSLCAGSGCFTAPKHRGQGPSPASHRPSSYLQSEGQEGTWQSTHKSYRVPLSQRGVA